jgi:hypothetical protein
VSRIVQVLAIAGFCPCDSSPCHPERNEGSLVDLRAIARNVPIDYDGFMSYSTRRK